MLTDKQLREEVLAHWTRLKKGVLRSYIQVGAEDWSDTANKQSWASVSRQACRNMSGRRAIPDEVDMAQAAQPLINRDLLPCEVGREAIVSALGGLSIDPPPELADEIISEHYLPDLHYCKTLDSPRLAYLKHLNKAKAALSFHITAIKKETMGVASSLVDAELDQVLRRVVLYIELLEDEEPEFNDKTKRGKQRKSTTSNRHWDDQILTLIKLLRPYTRNDHHNKQENLSQVYGVAAEILMALYPFSWGEIDYEDAQKRVANRAAHINGPAYLKH